MTKQQQQYNFNRTHNKKRNSSAQNHTRQDYFPQGTVFEPVLAVLKDYFVKKILYSDHIGKLSCGVLLELTALTLTL